MKYFQPIEFLDVEGIPTFAAGEPSEKGVIFHHGADAQKETDLALVMELAARGFRVLAPDAPGHGARTFIPRKPFPEIVAMVFATAVPETLAMRNRLVAEGAKKIFLVGRSVGGMRAVHAAAELDFAAMALVVAGGNFPLLFEKTASAAFRAPESQRMLSGGFLEQALLLDPLRVAERVRPMPVLMIGATRDEIVPVECARALAEKFQSRKDFTYQEEPSSGHALTPTMISSVADWLEGAILSQVDIENIKLKK